MKVLAYLNNIYPLSEDLKKELLLRLHKQELAKKEILLKEGQVCRNIYFVEAGLFRSFYSKADTEVNAWFMQEQDVIIAVRSFNRQAPSTETIQALEESTVSYISFEDLEYIYNTFPEFNIIGRLLTTHYYILSEERNLMMRREKAEDRYKYFSEHYPQLVQRIPQHYIASYLGVSAETLSRIRKRK